ncbi:hypothetical protein B0J14DRAFT_554469 [Halenospora varia]|nr:hypothetical protein B0J14DRAFT_554469 [Halenospora varia]
MDATEDAPRPPSPLKAPRKRKRIVISCTECHRRKQKCDRASPCSNCVVRGKQSLCHYENESARKQQLLEESSSAASVNGGAYSVIKPSESETAAQVTAFGYAKTGGSNNTTLGIFKKIENHDADASAALMSQMPSHFPDQSGLREKYKSMIRQLPSKQYIEKLLVTYFREVNYQYYPLDEGIFRDLLQDWYNLSFSTLNKGPMELPEDLQFFPALLFQSLALALQFQPLAYDVSLDSLKYAQGMSFDDLAADYSESGCQILCLLGKRNTTLITVQAGFLRTAYLKNVGMVTEAWHSLSSTIRDAQEIGLHRDALFKPRKKDSRPEAVLEGLWIEQLRRRMWLILSLWDIHMAIVLGRPTTIDTRDGKPPFPIDAPVPRNRREEAPTPRSESDPPTPLTMLLWNTEISAPLWDIFNLEKEDPHQNNFAKVEKMHGLINQITLHTPPFFRSNNPDMSFDEHPNCYWLPRARPVFQNGAAFTIMALHRPYIFTNSASRTAALKAGLDVLRAQRILFNLLSSLHYKMFALVLNTFDAIVLVAAIYILHPYENGEDLEDTLQHYEWGMERFTMMSARNDMAKAALGVLKAIHVRLKKALASRKEDRQPGTAAPTQSDYPTPPNPPAQAATTHASISSTSATENPSPTTKTGTTSTYTLPTISNLTSPPPIQPAGLTPNSNPASASATPQNPPSWETFSVPPSFNFSAMQPLQPLHDLVYNDLGTGMNLTDNVTIGYETGTWDIGRIGPGGGEHMGGNANQPSPAPWMFEGDFGSDSFWGFMNSYQP